MNPDPMLYHPDDPLITWLRDGPLDGITLGSTREDVLKKWGPDGGESDLIDLTYTGSSDGSSLLLVDFDGDMRIHCIQVYFDGSRDFQLPRQNDRLSSALNGETTESKFFDLLQDQEIDLHFLDRWPTQLHRKTFETRHGIWAMFESGVLTALTDASWHVFDPGTP